MFLKRSKSFNPGRPEWNLSIDIPKTFTAPSSPSKGYEDLDSSIYTPDTSSMFTPLTPGGRHKLWGDSESDGDFFSAIDNAFDEFCDIELATGNDLSTIRPQKIRGECEEFVDPELIKDDIKKLQKIHKARKQRKYQFRHPYLSKVVKKEKNCCCCWKCLRKRVRTKSWIHDPNLFYKYGWFILYLRLQTLVMIIYQMPFPFIPVLYRSLMYPLKIAVLDFDSYFNDSGSYYVSSSVLLGYGVKNYFNVLFIMIWTLLPLFLFVVWTMSKIRDWQALEKIFHVILRVLYVPVLTKLGPMAVCGGLGNIYGLGSMKKCDFGVDVATLFPLVILAIWAFGIPLSFYFDVRKRILYPSPTGHLRFISFLECEKMLKYSNAYQNLKLYKISCYKFKRIPGTSFIINGVYFKLFLDGMFVPWILISCWMTFGFEHPKFLCATTSFTLTTFSLLEMLVQPYRIFLHLMISQVSLWANVLISFLVWMKAVDLMNPFFVDSALSMTLSLFTLLSIAVVIGLMVGAAGCVRGSNWPVKPKEIKSREPELISLIREGYFLYFYSLHINPLFVRVELIDFYLGVLGQKYKKISRVEGHPLTSSVEHLILKLKSRYYEVRDISLFPNRYLREKLGRLRRVLMKRQMETCHIPRNKRRLVMKFLFLKSFSEKISGFLSESRGIRERRVRFADEMEPVVRLVNVRDDVNPGIIFEQNVTSSFMNENQFSTKVGSMADESKREVSRAFDWVQIPSDNNNNIGEEEEEEEDVMMVMDVMSESEPDEYIRNERREEVIEIKDMKKRNKDCEIIHPHVKIEDCSSEESGVDEFAENTTDGEFM